MKYKAERVSSYRFTSQHKLFLDANIWLYLYGPKEHNNYWVKVYSDAFNRILKAESKVYIDVLIVSEFINRLSKQECKLAGYPSKEFKIFRSSSDFLPVAQGIAASVKKITNQCIRTESTFSMLKINDILNDYAKGKSDFNDQVVTRLCKNKGFTLMTHDGDFDPNNLHILTENNYLLNKR